MHLPGHYRDAFEAFVLEQYGEDPPVDDDVPPDRDFQRPGGSGVILGP
jgi:hypothetical protein